MASSGTKAKSKIPTISGTKPSVKNAQLLISTGIPSLDHIIGGGLPIGSVFVIEEDKYGLYAKIMLKYFMAEGIVTSQPLLVASQNVEPSEFVSELPAVITNTEPQAEVTNTHEQIRIAWRYQNMKLVDSSPGGSQAFGHFYDLTKSMQQEFLQAADITKWHESSLQTQNTLFENPAYADLLNTIQQTLETGEYLISKTPEKRKILRIAIHSLGSRLWLCDREDSTHRDLLKFFYCFRALLRNSYAVGLITIPVNNFDNNNTFVGRIEHMSDIAIRLESFAGSAKEINPLFKDYNGLLHVVKLPALNTLAPHCPESRDLAFKLRRKRFVIEVLHLPPEFEDTAQREQDDVMAPTAGCASGSRGKLEFYVHVGRAYPI